MFTIALVCQKGGAGKTTIAVHLAVEAQRRGHRTLLIDLDPQASAAKVLDRRGDQPPDVVTEHPARLDVAMPAAAAEGYDLVVPDTAPQADQAALRAARAADLVLIPVRPSIVDLDAVQATMDVCQLAGRQPVFILSAVPAQGNETREAREVVSVPGASVSPVSLGDRKAFRIAFNDGQVAQELDPKSKAAAEITALFNSLNIPTAPHTHNSTTERVNEVRP
jgi:chromosome partitioning protein